MRTSELLLCLAGLGLALGGCGGGGEKTPSQAAPKPTTVTAAPTPTTVAGTPAEEESEYELDPAPPEVVQRAQEGGAQGGGEPNLDERPLGAPREHVLTQHLQVVGDDLARQAQRLLGARANRGVKHAGSGRGQHLPCQEIARGRPAILPVRGVSFVTNVQTYASQER